METGTVLPAWWNSSLLSRLISLGKLKVSRRAIGRVCRAAAAYLVAVGSIDGIQIRGSARISTRDAMRDTWLLYNPFVLRTPVEFYGIIPEFRETERNEWKREKGSRRN